MKIAMVMTRDLFPCCCRYHISQAEYEKLTGFGDILPVYHLAGGDPDQGISSKSKEVLDFFRDLPFPELSLPFFRTNSGASIYIELSVW